MWFSRSHVLTGTSGSDLSQQNWLNLPLNTVVGTTYLVAKGIKYFEYLLLDLFWTSFLESRNRRFNVIKSLYQRFTKNKTTMTSKKNTKL